MNAHDLRLRLLAVGAFVVGWPAVVNAAPTVYPRGVTIHDGDAAYPTDVMFSAADGNSYLIDMDGKVLKTWPHKGEPSKIVDPALIGGRKGVVGLPLDLVDSDAIPGLDGVGLVPGQATKKVDKTFGLVAWDGKVLWQWSGPASVGAALQHHDWDRLPNGNMLILSYVMRDNKAFSTGKIVDDMLYEVDQDGKVVWSWSATDHLDEFGFTADQLKLVHASTSPDYLHVNAAVALGPNHWEKAGDKRFAADNIIFSSRNANFIAIISRATGHVVWRMGPNLPPQAQGRTAAKLPRPVDQTSGQHNVHMIPDGLPGAGNLLVFDNEGEAGFPPVPRPLLGGSRILEIDPVADTVVWQYVGSMSDRPNWTFFSPFISSAQRLPNGNTLIDEGSNGRFFQVTPTGRIVWEYVSPYEGHAPGSSSTRGNLVYRAQAVPRDWVSSDARN